MAARLFITSREVEFINDLTKEIQKDILGMFITYFPISTIKTKIHPVYDEAVRKIFEYPIKLDCFVGQPKVNNRYDVFGTEQISELEVFVQARELIDRGFTVQEGDYFVYGTQVYEVLNFTFLNNIFGQIEYEVGYRIFGKAARIGEFDPNILIEISKDSNKAFMDKDVAKFFVQQRGLPENSEGVTDDYRQMRDRLGEDMADVALGEGPRTVQPDNTPENQETPPSKGNSFYNE